MRVSNTVYNHLSASLVPKKRSTTHKSSELKDVYSSMAKYNKNSPLYLLSMSESKQTRMIDIKEAAMTLKDISDGLADPESTIYKKKLIKSSDNDTVSASLRKNDPGDIPDELTIEVKSLAKEQVNTGKYLDKDDLDIRSGKYSFGIETINGRLGIELSVTRDLSNEDIQKDIINKINKADIGIKASLLDDGSETAIMLASTEPGTPATSDGLYFSLSRDDDAAVINDIFGIDNVSQYPSDSEFTINDQLHSSSSNNISINQAIELDFHKVSDGPVRISMAPDNKLIAEQMNQFVESYNNLVDLSKSEASALGTRSLKNDIVSMVNKHTDKLRSAGITLDDTGHLVRASENTSIEDDSEQFAELFSNMKDFKTDVTNAVEKISLDPVAYINKLIVTYPNTGDKLNNTYTKSLYSGLLFNNYA